MEFYEAQSESVCSDAYNWSKTLEAAMAKTNQQASFVVSAGDQIQTTPTTLIILTHRITVTWVLTVLLVEITILLMVLCCS